MGMSASQARYLSLIARQSNLEYQGQQINQERTILSQQCTDLYNSLLAMTVPTPPSTQDYTTVQYTGQIGATNYSFDASSIKPGNNGGYIVTVNQDSYGNSLQKNASIATVDNNSSGTMKVESVSNTVSKDTTVGTGTYSAADSSTTWMVPATLTETDDPANFYVFDGGSYRKGTATDKTNGANFFKMQQSGTAPSADAIPVKENTKTVKEGSPAPVTSAELAQLWVLDESTQSLRKATTDDVDGDSEPYSLKSNVKYYKESSVGTQSFPVKGAIDGIAINGHALFELSSADITEEQRKGYEAAIANSGLTKPNGEQYQASDFYIYFDDNGSANFVLKSDVNDGNNNATTYSYVANGAYSKPTTYNDCQLTFDPANGRITEISFPNYATTTDENGNTVYDYSKVESYTTMAVSAKTVTDDNAYNDAYAQYEYDQYKYDKAQQEINARTEVIQQEDRNLELKLQRLDNERTQITTEIEALDKVINDNIESSYKTFSG